MRIVEIQLPANDVSIPIENMRRWLDDVQFDPSTPTWTRLPRDRRAGQIQIHQGLRRRKRK
jgi:hypothetical protein